MKEVEDEMRSINANMELVREGVPEILQRTDAIQNATFNINSTLEARLGNLQTVQQNVLPEVKDFVKELPQLIENRLKLRLDGHIQQIVELLRTAQSTNFQSIAEIQKRVSRVIVGVSSTKFCQVPTQSHGSSKVAREAKPFARRL